MPDVELVSRPGVELIRTGSWPASSGTWDVDRSDLAAAIAAAQCPAIGSGKVWIGHTDRRFTRGDGEPAVGRIENLRTGDGGHTLLGDLVGVPAWLDQVMASAFPDRSVEGVYNARCALGHTHPFALDGVALLGVSRPGVGVLKPLTSLDDIKSLFGVTPAVAVSATVAATDRNQLKHYWTKDPEGLAKWAIGHPHPWTALYRELKKHVDPERAKRIASEWFHEVFGIWPGERAGKNPAGPG